MGTGKLLICPMEECASVCPVNRKEQNVGVGRMCWFFGHIKI